jgi:diguanylate cyclase (GGDEF)-like protein/PAS domain S-box-containing protein
MPSPEAALLEELRRSRRMLAAAQQLARIGSWEWDVAAGRVTWSDELFRMYGYEPDAFEPTYETFLEHVHPDDRESVEERNRRAFLRAEGFDDVKRVRRPDGELFLMRTQGEVLTDAAGDVVRMIGVCEDVTDRVRADETQALLASIVESSNDAIFTLTRDGTVTTWNPAAERLFGWTAAEAIGRPATDIVPPVDAAADHRIVAAAHDSAIDSWETVRRRKDGTVVPVSVVVSPVRDAAGGVSGVSVVARDVTERRRIEDQLRHLAEHDALTGLFNRRRFEEELARAVDHAARYGPGGAVIVLDLDNFKHVNDTLGHGAGDELIRSVARLLHDRLRATDVLARMGGDEFAILLPHAQVEEARMLARDIVQAVREHDLVLSGQRLRVTTSLGGTIVDAETGEGGALLAAADAAMYAAKDAGRDRAVIMEAGGRARTRRGINWQARIERALARDEFELHLQPVLDLRSNEVRRYEALLRMTGEGGLTLPGTFLPVAERVGLIHDIDRWVVREAIRLLAAHPGLELEVNLSGRSMDDDDVVRAVRDELHATGVDPSRLILEITETATIANMDDARRLASALTDLGCRFAIDDFGAGFGSFSYLKHLPAAYLKIDGDFVSSPRSRTDELVIAAIVGMARGLGKSTIAEFVGDDQTVQMLRDAGVDHAQGYHVGRPFPARELV